MEAKLYPNECVKSVTGFIPEGHRHLRLIVELCDGQRIVLHEASVAGIVRAYAMVALHPSRRAYRLVSKRLRMGERKQGYAEWQLVEDDAGEDEVYSWAMRVWENADIVS